MTIQTHFGRTCAKMVNSHTVRDPVHDEPVEADP